jgi:hypothetical protein
MMATPYQPLVDAAYRDYPGLSYGHDDYRGSLFSPGIEEGG